MLMILGMITDDEPQGVNIRANECIFSVLVHNSWVPNFGKIVVIPTAKTTTSVL